MAELPNFFFFNQGKKARVVYEEKGNEKNPHNLFESFLME